MSSMPILIIETHSRCNCRCEMCEIWRTTDSVAFSSAHLDAQMDSLDRLGTKRVVFTGGEPLMNPEIFTMSEKLRDRGISVTLLSTGLLFRQYAREIANHFDDVIVSVDGPPTVHDAVRRTPGAFSAIHRGMRAIRDRNPDLAVSARCVVQRRNHRELVETARAARVLGCDSISYLAADLTSSAFNRSQPWPILKQNEIALTIEQLPALDDQLTQLAMDSFVADSPPHLARIALAFRVHLGLERPSSPHCNAPFVSAFWRVDGSVQPCFFHPPVGAVGESSLAEVWQSQDASEFRRTLDIAENATCQRCVCSLYLT